VPVTASFNAKAFALTVVASCLISLGVSAFQSAVAGPLEDGRLAYARGDYASALNHWRQAADQGDAEAQTKIGVMYETGVGVTKDYAEAAKWYRKAADQNDANAEAALGSLIGSGFGVQRDDAEAIKWLRKAAEQGHARAEAIRTVLGPERFGRVGEIWARESQIRLGQGLQHIAKFGWSA
jgi:TPR repeat protein